MADNNTLPPMCPECGQTKVHKADRDLAAEMRHWRREYNRASVEIGQGRTQRDELVRLCHHYTDFGLDEILGLAGIPAEDFDPATIDPTKAKDWPHKEADTEDG